jgi:hypothetical protein
VPDRHAGAHAPDTLRVMSAVAIGLALPSEIAAGATQTLAWRAAYRLGDAALEVSSDCAAVVVELGDHYGECEIDFDDPDASSLPRARCTVRAVEGSDLALVRYDTPLATSAFDVALALLKHPAAAPEHVEAAPRADGWRPIVHLATGRTVVMARAQMVLVDVAHCGPRLLGQLLVEPVLAMQRGFLFAHAASVGIHGAGVVLVGPSGSGKTTTALTLASRGHRYFGDDVAALRTESGELLPFWRIAHVRPGPHAPSIGSHLAAGRWDAPYSDGLPRLRLRVADVFPTAASAPLPLRRALFLRRFAARPSVEPFKPTGSDFAAGSRFALNNTLWVAWGHTPPLRLMQFMLFLRLLEQIPCAWLDVGDPEATAQLIEHTMEDSWH